MTPTDDQYGSAVENLEHPWLPYTGLDAAAMIFLAVLIIALGIALARAIRR